MLIKTLSPPKTLTEGISSQPLAVFHLFQPLALLYFYLLTLYPTYLTLLPVMFLPCVFVSGDLIY